MPDQKRVVNPWIFLASLAIVVLLAIVISRNNVSVDSKPIDAQSAANAPEDAMLKTSDNPLVATNYGAALPSEPIGAPVLGTLVPEPASLAMLGLLTVITRRRRHLHRA